MVDDDEDIRVSLDRGLRLSGFDVRTAADGDSALRAVADRTPDCVVLDVGLPGEDGVAVVETLRERGVAVPVLMLSARTSVDDRVTGLAAGADDYLVKPFALAELVARLRALLRRIPSAAPSGLTVGPLTVDPARQPDVQHDAVGHLLGDGPQRGVAVAGGADREAGQPQPPVQRDADVLVVVDDEDVRQRGGHAGMIAYLVARQVCRWLRASARSCCSWLRASGWAARYVRASAAR